MHLGRTFKYNTGLISSNSFLCLAVFFFLTLLTSLPGGDKGFLGDVIILKAAFCDIIMVSFNKRSQLLRKEIFWNLENRFSIT